MKYLLLCILLTGCSSAQYTCDDVSQISYTAFAQGCLFGLNNSRDDIKVDGCVKASQDFQTNIKQGCEE